MMFTELNHRVNEPACVLSAQSDATEFIAGWEAGAPCNGATPSESRYTGNPYVRFDEGTEVVRPHPTLLAGA